MQMKTLTNTDTSEKIIQSLGYRDPMDAARQQARMILLGRRSRYEAEIKKLEGKWRSSLDEMRARYQEIGNENFELDDDFLTWQWYEDAIEHIDSQLAVLAGE
jgi:hypothetical protein